MSTCRLLVLGAGFSRSAGLPLGDTLFQGIRLAIERKHGRDNWVERELERPLRYLRLCDGRIVLDSEVNSEEFLGFLDAEHYLGLKGKDTWSNEGNEAQLMIRNGIAEVLYERIPPGSDLPDQYLQFAERLNTSDWVLSFNYDTVLEQALEAVGRPYRLFPHRYSEVNPSYSTVDDDKDELVLLKLHGSINWFDRTPYDKRVSHAALSPIPYKPEHCVFGNNRVVDSHPLCDGLRPPGDALTNIFVVKDIGPLLTSPFWQWTPLILTPSTGKLFYANPLRDFWWGAQRSGGLSLGFGVVGYSLPKNDEYARQMLFHMVRNYQGYEPNLERDGRIKTKVRLLDFRDDDRGKREFRSRYRFCLRNRTDYWWKGLSSEAVDWLFAD